MKKLATTLLVMMLGFGFAAQAQAGISISPYVSISSTKKIKPGASGTEKETIKQRETYGIKGSISFWRLMKFSLGVGQSTLTTTEKTSEVVDEYDEIDMEKDLDMDTDNPDKEVRITDTRNEAKATFMLDPSFWIFVLRAKAGVTAKQRIIEKEEDGAEPVKTEPPITYKPHAGVGFGVRLTSRLFWMAEYEAYFYKFPETEPFERAVTVSFAIGI